MKIHPQEITITDGRFHFLPERLNPDSYLKREAKKLPYDPEPER